MLDRSPTDALALGELRSRPRQVWAKHSWTQDSARVTADALDALGRTEEAKALREKYGVMEPEKPKPPETSVQFRANLCDLARTEQCSGNENSSGSGGSLVVGGAALKHQREAIEDFINSA